MPSWQNYLNQFESSPKVLQLQNGMKGSKLINLPDGCYDSQKIILLANDYSGYTFETRPRKLNNKKLVLGGYKSSFLHGNNDIELFTLGRYFSGKLKNYINKENPRKHLSNRIVDLKKKLKVNEFTNWDKEFIKNTEELIKLIISSSNQSKIILTAVPNSDGNNRFSKFINNFSQSTSFTNEIVRFYPDLFMCKKHSPTMGLSEAEKYKKIFESLTFNEKYKAEVSEGGFHTIILDDLFTWGSHLKVMVDKINKERKEDEEADFLLRLANGSTKYVRNAIIQNTKRKGVDVDSILKKHSIDDVDNVEHLKSMINLKKNAFSGVFLGSTQRLNELNFSEGSFFVIPNL